MKKLFCLLLCSTLAICVTSCQTGSEREATPAIPTEVSTVTITEGSNNMTTEPPPTVSIKIKSNDPYSYIAKAYYALSLKQNFDYYCNAMINMEQFKKEFAKGFEMLPADALGEFVDSFYDGIWRNLDYSLYDIDGNGTKEFLLGKDNYIYDIYTIQNDVAVQQIICANYPSTSLLKNGIIAFITDFERNGVSYYRFEDGKLQFQLTLIHADPGEPYESYEIYKPDETSRRISKEEYERLKKEQESYEIYKPDETSRRIGKEEYERLKKEQEGDGQKIDLNWKPLAEYGR